ncbi:hypothetical protein DFH11DRAFT_1548839 [Phellopilus nigrolimitatus]|nr:hypothetical protein DFH11DRAFT_1548839 [Phellopilus nigrolimitatus]
MSRRRVAHSAQPATLTDERSQVWEKRQTSDSYTVAWLHPVRAGKDSVKGHYPRTSIKVYNYQNEYSNAENLERNDSYELVNAPRVEASTALLRASPGCTGSKQIPQQLMEGNEDNGLRGVREKKFWEGNAASTTIKRIEGMRAADGERSICVNAAPVENVMTHVRAKDVRSYNESERRSIRLVKLLAGRKKEEHKLQSERGAEKEDGTGRERLDNELIGQYADF